MAVEHMCDELFALGASVGVGEVLADRDERVALQRLLLERFADQTLVVIKLNVPGPIKSTTALHRLFCTGSCRFLARLPDSTVEERWRRPAGSTLFALTRAPADRVKRLAMDFEDADPLGRLFDVDVLRGQDGRALSRVELGAPARRCYICERPAKECARARRHTIEQLRRAMQDICEGAAEKEAGDA